MTGPLQSDVYKRQVDKSRSRQEGGAGLGLALCVKIAEVHGARLDIVSQIGAGTKVRAVSYTHLWLC